MNSANANIVIDAQYDGECKWLHISDMHLLLTHKQHQSFQMLLYGRKGKYGVGDDFESGGLRWVLRQNKIDFILCTGDIFNKGESPDFDDMRDCIYELYDLCATNCGWTEWQSGEKKYLYRFFFCPGNHDLERRACKERGASSLIRADELRNNPPIDANGCFSPQDDDIRCLFTERAFGNFYEVMGKNICGKESLNAENISNCECYAFSVRLRNIDSTATRPLVFCGINTALVAGFGSNTQSGDGIKPTEADAGKLCFISRDAQKNVSRELDRLYGERIALVIFGHHPVSSLCAKAREAFANFMQDNGSQTYLCGHGHLPASDDEPFAQYTRGVMSPKQFSTANFTDARYEEEFFGFSIDCFKVIEDEKSTLLVDSYVFLSRGGTHFWSKIQKWQTIETRPWGRVDYEMPQTVTPKEQKKINNKIIDNTENQTELENEKNCEKEDMEKNALKNNNQE